jgi:PAS domain-containing protein
LAAVDAIQNAPAPRTDDEFQEVVSAMRGEELELLVTRDANAKLRLAEMKIVLLLGTALGLLSAAAAGWSIQRDNSRRGLAEDALFLEKERAQVTLDSIGDAVVCTDISGKITFLNLVAEKMTGWFWRDAVGRPGPDVLRILDATRHEPSPDPMGMAVGQDRTVHLPASPTQSERVNTALKAHALNARKTLMLAWCVVLSARQKSDR